MAVGATMHPLDNPIWHALTTSQAEFALTCKQARRFPAEVTTLAGFPRPTRANYAALALLLEVEEVIALFLEAAPAPPAGWTIVEAAPLLQMIHEGRDTIAAAAIELEELNDADVPQMLTLTELTKPGPFGQRTHELGTYLGIRRAGRLIAMAGERLCMPGYVEVSAVCTHPEYLGHGYARALVTELVRRIRARGAVPFLHARPENTRAIDLYARLGFTRSKLYHLAVLCRSAE